MSQYRTLAYCKNHPEQLAGYFLSQQPWHKLCSACALNTALCGKKIQKQLSTTQFERKMILNSLSNQFKRFIHQYSQENDNIVQLLQQVEQNYTKLVNENLKVIEQFTRSIVQAKQQLFDLYDKEIKRKTNSYFERQSKSILVSLQIKKEMEYIQSNFGNLIQTKNQDQFQMKVQKWREILDSAKAETITKEQLTQYQQKMKQVSSLFSQSFQLFTQTAYNFSKNIFRLQSVSAETNQFAISCLEETFQKNIFKSENKNSVQQKQEAKKCLTLRQPKTQLKLRARSRAMENYDTSKKIQCDDSKLTKRSSKAKIQTKALSKHLIPNT